MTGNYLRLFSSQSKNQNLVERGGGGVVTTVLANAFEQGIITNALVVVSDNKEPWAKYINATSTKQILDSSGSKYTLLSFNKFANQINSQTAVVGLPCQIKNFKDKKCIKIGLFCGISISRKGFDYLFHQLKVDKARINQLDYRKPGGGLKIEMLDGKTVEYPSYSWLSYFYSYPFCLNCVDNTNHYADISVGDRHFEGSSNVIVRTEIGEKLLDSAIYENKLITKELTFDQFFLKIQTPYYIKEIIGGYNRLWYIQINKNIYENIPLNLLRFVGRLIMKKTSYMSNKYFKSNQKK
jgi:coenzyme F420-reducing hydrogenase beta subunit